MKKKKLMTQKRYLSLDGLYCPKCESENISADKIEVDGSYGWQEIKCENCGFVWQDLWTLTGYVTN